MKKWVLLVQITTFPRTIASSDPRLLDAFSTLDRAMVES